MSGINEPFQKYIGEKTALYGLGTETKGALLSLEDRFEILGLLDSFREEGELYGKKIVSLSYVVEAGVKLIIVVARPGSCKAIAGKIGDICSECGIALMDIRGKNLLERESITYSFMHMKGETKDELYKKIDKAEVISFDLFDTLILREVLFSSDIIELMDSALKMKDIYIDQFPSKRLEAEKRLSDEGAPTLERLYKEVLKCTQGGCVSAGELAELEWEIDCGTLLRREAICEAYKYCIQKKKAVYIVTDTYYTKTQIEQILRECLLTGYTGLLVSCEYNTGKRQHLFDKLLELEGEKQYLHIGDDLITDMEMALKKGMDTYRIFSKEDLLDAVGNMGLEMDSDSLAERLKVGMFSAKLFNDPFQFETAKKKIEVSDAYDIGYLLCAPIITDFVFWFRERVQHYGLHNIWFSARDGYLLQKMYQMLDKNADTVYFLTSRMAAVRAGMMNEEDIVYVDSMRFSGTLEENLKARFGLECGRTEKKGGNAKRWDKKETDLLRYKDDILRQAVNEREKYMKYIEKLALKGGDVAFFDFVAKGTTQMYVERFAAHRLKGMYFLQLEAYFMKDKGLDIESFYDIDETDGSSIYDNYYVLETVLTAPHPCVWGFDDSGNPVFVKETRKEKDIRCVMQAQAGILDYFGRYLKLLPANMESRSKRLDETFLGLIHNLKISDKDFQELIVEDPFFNRMTDIKELI